MKINIYFFHVTTKYNLLVHEMSNILRKGEMQNFAEFRIFSSQVGDAEKYKQGNGGFVLGLG